MGITLNLGTCTASSGFRAGSDLGLLPDVDDQLVGVVKSEDLCFRLFCVVNGVSRISFSHVSMIMVYTRFLSSEVIR